MGINLIVYHINESCIGCSACIVACAVNAIIATEGKYKIDQKFCINCGACTELCPVNAITIKEN